jgi:hypothetical protein
VSIVRVIIPDYMQILGAVGRLDQMDLDRVLRPVSELGGALGRGSSDNSVVGEQRPVVGVQDVMQPE